MAAPARRRERPLRVGLTGGLAAGKSTVAELLLRAGIRVVDADRLVAELYAPGEEGARAVRELFGERFLDSSGGVDHRTLAAEVFADEGARRRLEQAIHPLVRRRFRRLAEEAGEVIVLEAVLLVEAGYAPDFDLVISVEADPEVRVARAVARGLSPEEARARLRAQGDGEARRAAAHRLLWNNGDLQALERKVAALAAELRSGVAA